ncbi:hypothetical protein GOBAR_DD11640 [Gossypium barbadense]|nr:hypothetical protein GOBAR_DD11640 [Gossypium barbadense]
MWHERRNHSTCEFVLLRFVTSTSGKIFGFAGQTSYFCFKTFDDRVKTWMAFNEPRVVAAFGFDNGINPPNRCSKKFRNCTDRISTTEPYIAAHH